MNAKNEKKEFHISKKAVDIRNVDIEKILVSDAFANQKIKKWIQNTSKDIKLIT